jgi:hypothetical protein
MSNNFLILGLWVVKKEWIYECLEKQAWVPYDKYEAVDYWPAVKTARLAKGLFACLFVCLRFIW